MIEFTVHSFARQEWDDLTMRFDGLSFLQCWAWGEARAAQGGWKIERGTLTENGDVIGVAQVLVRSIPLAGRGLVWVNRGPLWCSRAGSGTYADMLFALRRHYADAQGCYLRIAPPIDEGGIDAAALGRAGFVVTDTPGWASARLDLKPPLESLRAGLHAKWRNSLSRAERAGIDIAVADSGVLFDHFLSEYDDFIVARGFDTTVTPTLLSALQDALPEERKLRCFSATRNGEALGSVLFAYYGQHAEYLSATLLPAGRTHNAGQFLLWRAIEDAKTRGCNVLDLGGMDPALTAPGVFKFKKRVGGAPYRLVNEIEATCGGLWARLVRWRVHRARAAADPQAES